MFGIDIIRVAGNLIKHLLGVMLLCWQRMVRAALITWVIGFLLVEIVGTVVLGHFPAPILTHAVALIFAFALAYGVMLTVLIDEFVIGALDTIRMLEGDAKAGLRAAKIAAEREAGEAGGGLMALLGHTPRRHTSPRARAAMPAKSPVKNARNAAPVDAATVVPLTAEEQYTQTHADIQATDEFSNTAPRQRVNARPVRADQLPRIGWTLEQLDHQQQPTPAMSSPAAPMAEDTATTNTATPISAPDVQPDEPPFVVAAPIMPHIVPASQLHLDDLLHDASPDENAEEQAAPDDYAVPHEDRASVVSAPIEAPGQRTIWSRISKALVGDVHPPTTAIPSSEQLYHDDLAAN